MGVSSVDAIKVDIEGGEYALLTGAETTLKQIRPLLIIELVDQLLRRSGRSRKEVVDLLHRHDYLIFEIEDSNDTICLPRDNSNCARLQSTSWASLVE